MANTTIEELLNLAYEVRDADQAGENTALRVGGLLEEIIQYLSTVVGLDTLQAILAEYATVSGNGVIHWRQSRIVCLASMGYDLDNIDGGNWNYTNSNGDIVFRPSGDGVLNVVGTTGDYSVLQNVVYVNNHTGHAYLWKLVGNTYKMVEIRDSSPTTIITYLNTPHFSQVAVGESYFYTSGSTRKIAIKLSSDEVYSFDPDPKKIYVFLDTRQAMVWDSGNRQWISVGGNLIQIINDLTTGGGDKALSAEMGKRLKEKVEDVQANIQRLYNNLGNIAFWDAAAKSAAAPIPLDWGGTKHLVTLNLSLTNAVVKHNGTAVANGATIQVEEYDTLTLLVEAESGYTLQSVTSSTTGAAVTDNGNGTYNVALTMGQSNVTLAITATAAQAYTITYGTMANCSVVTSPAPTSILSGQSVEIEFSAESGYELDSSCFTVANADKAWSSSTNKLTISNATGNVTISATAESPKIKFLKGYRWDNSTSYNQPSIINSQWLVDDVDKHENLAASEMIKLPAPSTPISSWPTVFVYWGINPKANDTTRPIAIGFYEVGDNDAFTFLGYYLFKNTVLYNTVSATSCGWASGKSASDVQQAYNNGKLGIRVTINTSNNALLTHTDGRGVTFGEYTFKPNNPAGNYKLVADATGFEDEIFVVE